MISLIENRNLKTFLVKANRIIAKAMITVPTSKRFNLKYFHKENFKDFAL